MTPSLADALKACEAHLPNDFRAAHARLFAEAEHLPRLAECLLRCSRDGAPAGPPPPHFAAECTPPLAEAFAFFIDPLTLWNADPASPDVPRRFAHALVAAGTARVLVLLGQRRTPASVTDARALPPPRDRLLAVAGRLHDPDGGLTVVGRALTKHVHRCPDAFWGDVGGPAAAKNAAALRVLTDLLDRATWWNVFGHFQHDLVYEVRVPTGHGARWGRLGDEFIGFLEPFDEARCASLAPK